MSSTHRFALTYHDDDDGRWAAREAVDQWFTLGLIDTDLWGAMYDRIDSGPCKHDTAWQAAVVTPKPHHAHPGR